MPWFVFRIGTDACPTIYTHRDGYPTRVAAEEAAWDNSRFSRQPQGREQVDESVPPFIAEGTDMPAALETWSAQLANRGGPDAFRRHG